MILNIIKEDPVYIHRCLDFLWRQVHSEALLALGPFDDDSVLRVLHDVVCIDHLAHQVGSSSVVLCLLLGLLSSSLCLFSPTLCLLDSASKVGQLSEFGFDLLLPGDITLLLLLDLLFGPPSLGPYLQHVGSDALRDYR